MAVMHYGVWLLYSFDERNQRATFGGYMKTIVSKNYLDRIIELYGTPDIKIIFIDFMDLEFEEIKECPSLFCGATLCDR